VPNLVINQHESRYVVTGNIATVPIWPFTVRSALTSAKAAKHVAQRVTKQMHDTQRTRFGKTAQLLLKALESIDTGNKNVFHSAISQVCEHFEPKLRPSLADIYNPNTP
jgi:hypothetical protein